VRKEGSRQPWQGAGRIARKEERSSRTGEGKGSPATLARADIKSRSPEYSVGISSLFLSSSSSPSPLDSWFFLLSSSSSSSPSLPPSLCGLAFAGGTSFAPAVPAAAFPLPPLTGTAVAVVAGAGLAEAEGLDSAPRAERLLCARASGTGAPPELAWEWDGALVLEAVSHERRDATCGEVANATRQ